MDKFRFVGWVKGQRSSRKIPTSILWRVAEDPSSGVLQVLTIDLIHDWCQWGTISRLVFEHDQWHALIGGSPWREKRLRWQEPIVTIDDSTSSAASPRDCSPAFCVSGRSYTCFPGILSCYFKRSRPYSPFVLLALNKTATLKERNADKCSIRKAINTSQTITVNILHIFFFLYMCSPKENSWIFAHSKTFR